jgi:DNA-binding NarL/FixJ family response regulator
VDLVRLMMEGKTDAEIAAAIGCEEAEVRSRLEKVFTRMGAPSRSVATLYAFMAGII